MSKPIHVLVVDDEESMLELVCEALTVEKCTMQTAQTLAAAKTLIGEGHFDVCVTDIMLPDGKGSELINHLRVHSPATSIIAMTGFPDATLAKSLEELEVVTFLIKPFSMQQLRFSLTGAIQRSRTLADNTTIAVANEYDTDLGLIGTSPYFQHLRTQVRVMASGDFPVLIQGESGTGKEIIAHAVHNLSFRKTHTIITINCAAIPHHLEEAEFFGYAKGAFTGATSSKTGIIECADKTSLFLDEIGELLFEVQAKLLRVLDKGEFVRVGDTAPRTVDLRIISATNRRLDEMVTQKLFRKDLFYRLNGATMTTSPLTAHREDIPYLAHYFVETLCPGKQITSDAMRLLCNFPWPGNIRELKHAMRLLCTIAKASKRINSAHVLSVLKIEDTATSGIPFALAKDSFEKKYFTDLLNKHNGNVTHAANEAGILRPNFMRKLKDLGVSAQEFKAESL